MVAPDSYQTRAMLALIDYYYGQTGEKRWLEAGIICTADEYGVSGAKDFIANAPEYDITISSFQQFLVGATDVEVEVRELKNSEARVFISFMQAQGYQTLMREADKQDIIGNEYIWICSDGCATDDIFSGLNREREADMRDIVKGMFGIVPESGSGPVYEEFLQRWDSLDPSEYPGSNIAPTAFTLLAYDSAFLIARAYDLLYQQGNFSPNGTELFIALTSVSFLGASGNVTLFANGDRAANYDIVNYWPDNQFHSIMSWNEADGLVVERDAFFRDGTTTIPDLGVETSFEYWSCHDKESHVDRTGKTIKRETPDGDDPNNIHIDYECDQFIDCDNMSDEAYQCTPSLVVAFIVVGIITGLLIGINFWFIPAVILFGCIVQRNRILLAGRLFLLCLGVAAFLGLVSTYTWYGKPETAACNFQVWLFGLSVTILVSAIFSKNFLRFRTLGCPIAKVRKLHLHMDIEFIIYFIVSAVIPVFLIILWTAISTPKADIEKHAGDDHWVCTTGGVTGPPGGLVFFFVLVGYFGFLLLCSFILMFLNRKAPQVFMDNRLMFISMFNLGFLSAVIIPVFFVLRYISPFAAWLVRTLGIIYGFVSTLWIHLVPKMIGIVIVDKFADNNASGKAGKGARKRDDTDDPSLSASLTQSATMG